MAVWVIAQLTFREAARRKILLAAVVLGALFLVVYGIGLGFIAQKESEDPMPSIMVRNEFNHAFRSIMATRSVRNALATGFGVWVLAVFFTIRSQRGDGAVRPVVSCSRIGFCSLVV